MSRFELTASEIRYAPRLDGYDVARHERPIGWVRRASYRAWRAYTHAEGYIVGWGPYSTRYDAACALARRAAP